MMRRIKETNKRNAGQGSCANGRSGFGFSRSAPKIRLKPQPLDPALRFRLRGANCLPAGSAFQILAQFLSLPSSLRSNSSEKSRFFFFATCSEEMEASFEVR
jgi:hypothetical protein